MASPRDAVLGYHLFFKRCESLGFNEEIVRKMVMGDGKMVRYWDSMDLNGRIVGK